MWTSNVDKQDNLINGQTGSIKHIEFFDGRLFEPDCSSENLTHTF